jgi:hypothetical protein
MPTFFVVSPLCQVSAPFSLSPKESRRSHQSLRPIPTYCIASSSISQRNMTFSLGGHIHRKVVHVRFGSKADICCAADEVSFTPNSDRKSGHPHKVMSALAPKADMCGALVDVCYGPIADISQHKRHVRFLHRAVETSKLGLCEMW